MCIFSADRVSSRNRVHVLVCGLQMGSNLGMWVTADNTFFFRLTVEKIHAFSVFTKIPSR